METRSGASEENMKLREARNLKKQGKSLREVAQEVGMDKMILSRYTAFNAISSAISH